MEAFHSVSFFLIDEKTVGEKKAPVAEYMGCPEIPIPREGEIIEVSNHPHSDLIYLLTNLQLNLQDGRWGLKVRRVTYEYYPEKLPSRNRVTRIKQTRVLVYVTAHRWHELISEVRQEIKKAPHS